MFNFPPWKFGFWWQLHHHHRLHWMNANKQCLKQFYIKSFMPHMFLVRNDTNYLEAHSLFYFIIIDSICYFYYSEASIIMSHVKWSCQEYRHGIVNQCSMNTLYKVTLNYQSKILKTTQQIRLRETLKPSDFVQYCLILWSWLRCLFIFARS